MKRTASLTLFLAYAYIPTALVAYFAFTKNYVPSASFTHIRVITFALFAPILLKYIFHLVIAPWFHLVERSRSKRQTKQLPSVSVLVAAWNEEVGVCATLQSIANTGYPNLEIVVVNDGSTDKTHQVVTGFIAAQRKRRGVQAPTFIYRNVPNGGKAAALNVALAQAHGDIVVTVDADSVMDKKAITNLIKRYDDPNVASVAGNVAIGNRTKSLGILQQLEYLYGFYFKRADSIMNSVYIVGGAAASYRREIITRLGGFDEAMITEDIELSTRLQDHGYKVRYAPDAIVYTEGPSDFSGLCKQRLRWKYGRLLTFFKYRHLFFSMDKNHNKYLTFVTLPIALFAELLLLFEGILVGSFLTYTVITNDFVPLAYVTLFVCLIVCWQIVSDPIARYHKNLLLFAPGAWIIFYIMDVVEFQALVRSIWRLATKQTFSWQRWSRVGVFGEKPQ